MHKENSQGTMRTYLLASIPLLVFLALAAIFYKQLFSDTNPSDLPSALIGQKSPGFPDTPLPGLKRDGVQIPAITAAITQGKVSVINVWASWCVPCRVEHPVIEKLARDERIVVAGVNYKDKTPNALRFLGGLGNPYAAVSIDPDGATSIDWGVYGIPETFILAKDGTIIHKHVGPISEAILAKKIMPVIEEALAK